MPESRDLALVRQALARELDTINHYQDLRDQATEPGVQALLEHLMNEEKEHVAELTAVLRKLDPIQDAHFTEGHAASLFQEAPNQSRRAISASLTVGSLIGTPFV